MCKPESFRDYFDWQENICVACAIFNKFYKKEKYMKLDTNETDRSYLFGRLLALAERIENTATNYAGQTNAERLFTRFTMRPGQTFSTLQKQLVPYFDKLYGNGKAGLANYFKNQIAKTPFSDRVTRKNYLQKGEENLKRFYNQLVLTPINKLFNAKILTTLTFTLPSALVSSILMAIGVAMSFVWALTFVVMAVSVALFSAVIGLWFNLISPQLNWKKEAEVVKQGLAVLWSIIATFVLSGIAVGLSYLLTIQAIWIFVILTVAFLASGAIIYINILKNSDKYLRKIE